MANVYRARKCARATISAHAREVISSGFGIGRAFLKGTLQKFRAVMKLPGSTV